MLTTRALALSALLLAAATAAADEPCAGFTWNVAAERALFDGRAVDVVAGKDVGTAPAIVAATAYSVALAPQALVAFAAPPGKAAVPDGANGGVLTVYLGHGGRYRLSVDVPAWVDVIAGGKPTPSQAFQGSHGCNAPHKIVEFDLPPGQTVIQISASLPPRVRLAVTEAPQQAVK